MTKHLRTLMAFSAIGITTAALPAFAGEFEPLHVTVPFSFVAGKTALPAGDYVVTETENHAVLIRGNHGSAILLGQPGYEEESDRNSLAFERTEKGVYLKCVRMSGRPVSVVSLAADTDK